MDIMALRNDLEEVCAKNGASVQKDSLIPKLPAYLYHYTTIQGVHGILGKGAIWATSVDYLNDTTEPDYTVGLIDELIHKLIYEETKSRGGEEFGVVNQLLWVRYELFQHRSRSNYFVTCFCEVSDLLSQWRAYGQNGGFSLNFSADKLESLVQRLNDHDGGDIDTKEERSWYFEKMVYDKRTQRDLVESVLKSCIQAYSTCIEKHSIDQTLLITALDKDADFRESFKRFAQYWAKKLLRFVTLFKHPAFSEEKEWRMVHRRSTADCKDLSFRDGKGWLIPYTEVKIDLNTCLASITCGPPSSSLSVQSLRTLMNSLGLQEKPINRTTAPLRV